MRRLNADDVRNQTEVQVLFLNNGGPYVRGTVIAYAEEPTVAIRTADGSIQWVSTILPWEPVNSPGSA